MRNFFSNTILFIVIVVFLISFLIYGTNNYINYNSKFNISKNVTNIVIGHSHPECAFNDSLIVNFKNFATSGESYFYNYYKLVELLKQNNHIKTVFIEFSNNQINKEMDNWIWSDPFLSKGYKTYAPFIDVEAKSLLVRNSPLVFFNGLSVQLLNNLKTILSKDYDYTKKIGGYLSLKKNKIDSLLAYSTLNDSLRFSEFKVSEINISYLEKIITICKIKKVKVYLIRSPLHEKYYALNNEMIFQKILKSNFSDTEFLDFKDFPLNNSEYADFEHLNYLGSKKFSVFFNKILNNGLLKVKNKQNYINLEMINTQVE